MNEYIKKRKIIFFTLFYPFTHHGVSYDFYVASEVTKLAEKFDSVDIISLSTNHDGRLPTPNNVKVHNFHPVLGTIDKLFFFLLFTKKPFRSELKNLKSIYKQNFTIGLFKAIAIYAIKADKFNAFLKKLLAGIDFKNDEVLVYCYWNFEYALGAALLKEQFPIKLIVRTHSLDLYFDRMPENYQPFRRFVFTKSDLSVFISEQGSNYFVQVHQIPDSDQQKIFINRIGIENSLSVYDKKIDKLHILSNAWVQPLKRIDLLIQALALLNDIEIKWTHIGDDSGVDPARFTTIQKVAAEYLSGKKNIRYEFVGKKSLKEIFDLYQERNINLFINLSTTEGTPVSMMESLSFGVPIIGTKVGGVPEIIEDGVNGFLLPVDVNEYNVAEKIREYFLLPQEKRSLLSKNAYATWNQKFNADKNGVALMQRISNL